MAKSELKKAKDKAWTEFSKYIRTRDCLATTKDPEVGICISCNRRIPFKKLQAGHLIPGRHNVILFDEELVHAQCYACNCLLGGNLAEYYRNMIRKHGQEYVDELMDRKFKPTIKFTLEYLKEIRETYKKKTEELIIS